jgi:hypothetical protein
VRLALYLALVLVLAQDRGVTPMSNVISVSVVGPSEPKIVGSPVPSTVTVSNVTTRPIRILLPYPNPGNLEFDSEGNGVIEKKKVDVKEDERTIEIPIPAGRTYTSVYYLNRYFRFLAPGTFSARYRLTVPVWEQGMQQWIDNNVDGKFDVTLRKGSESELRADLEQYSKKLNSPSPQRRSEAAEALVNLDTPVSVDYLEPMLSINNLEVEGIHALARFPSPMTSGLITGMLSYHDSNIVAAALSEIDRMGIPIDRSRIRRLLTAPNPSSRWLALQWLSAHPDADDLPLILKLANDDNEQVRKLAKSYSDALGKPR